MRGAYTVLVGLILLAVLPVMAALAVVIALTSGFPVLFRQKRAGKDGVPFIMYKFRTMIVHAESLQKGLRGRNESRGPTFKLRDDPRFTTVGRFLSHTGLDELPQLFNVLRGDMAFIGPRPLPVAEAARLAPWMRERHRVLPGIISPAILTGKYHQNFESWMKSDIAYARQKALGSDAVLLCQFVMFLGKLIVSETVSYIRR